MADIEVAIISRFWGEDTKDILTQLLPSNVTLKCLDVSSGGHAINFNAKLDENQLQQCQTADIVIADRSFLPQMYGLPKLKWLQATHAGVDKVIQTMRDLVKNNGKPYFITTRFTGDYYGKLMTEYCLSYIIAIERGFIDHRDLQSSKQWQRMKEVTPKTYRTIEEVTVGIIGLGSIGSVIAKSFHKLGTNVIGYNRSAKTELQLKEMGVSYFSTQLEDILTRSEYIICILPHTSSTIGLLNGKFNVCKQKPVFINLGRGSVVSTDEIIKALDEGFLSKVVLDVFEEEPLPQTNPLWTHPKVLVTPHISAVTTARHLARLFKHNYDKFIKNEKLDFVIDWENEY